MHALLRLGDQLADRPAEAQRVERSRHRRIGVDRVAVVVGGGGPRSRDACRRTCGRGARRSGAAQACRVRVEVGLVAVLRLGQLARARRRPRGRAPDRSSAARMPAANPSGVALGQDRDVVVEHLRVRQQPRRDDRPARAQVLIDLQRRVGAACCAATPARRRRRGTRESPRPAAGRRRSTASPMPARCGLRARRVDLVRPAAGEHEPRVRPLAPARARIAREQQIEPLIGLERAGVEHHRRRRRRARARARTRGARSRRPARRRSRARSRSARSARPARSPRTTSCELRTDHDDHARPPDRRSVRSRRRRASSSRERLNAKLRELLRQARVHVVEVRQPEQRRERRRRCSCPLRANARRRTAPLSARRSAVSASSAIERHLGQRRTDPDVADERRPEAPEDAQPGSDTSLPNGYVTRSTVWPSSSSARMRWYSLNGVPRGSKNGSGAIMRIFTMQLTRNCRERGAKGQRKSRHLRELSGKLVTGRCTVDDLPDVTRRGRRARARASSFRVLKAVVSVGLLCAALLARRCRPAVDAWRRTASVAVAGRRAGALSRDDPRRAPGAGACCSAPRTSRFPFRRLTASFLVATFFNNFLPSNIGGDVIRIADTAPAAGSKTLATTVVLIDRGHRPARAGADGGDRRDRRTARFGPSAGPVGAGHAVGGLRRRRR